MEIEHFFKLGALQNTFTDTYYSFFLNNPLPKLWTLILLTLARIVPIIALTPFLGAKVMADPIKIGFAVALLPLFLPYTVGSASQDLSLDVTFILLMIKEALIGALLGFLMSIPFYAAQGAGALIDHQAGGQSLQVTDPTTQVQSSPTGLLYNNVMIVAFFLIGGPFLFFDAIFSSFQAIPVDKFIPAAFFSKDTPLYFATIKMIHQFMVMAVQLSAPCLIALLLSDLFLGIANRMAPQVQISFLLWSMKAYVGTAMLWAGWWFILKQIEVQSFDWVNMLQKLAATF